jgi:alpha-galactosidase
MELYQLAAPVIKYGTSRRFDAISPSWRHPEGWQAVRRISGDGKSILLVVHAFANAPAAIEIPWPDGIWQLAGKLSCQPSPPIIDGNLIMPSGGDFNAAVFLFKSIETP